MKSEITQLSEAFAQLEKNVEQLKAEIEELRKEITWQRKEIGRHVLLLAICFILFTIVFLSRLLSL